MIIELKISGNVRERKNGLIEFRNPLFGSVYGRSIEELHTKLERKISLAKAHILKKPAKKKKSPMLSAFYEETYLPYKKSRNLAVHTIKGIEYNFNYLRQTFDKPIAEYTPKMIESFLLSIEKTRKAQLLQGLLNNIFKKAVLDGLLERNPCDPIDHIIHETDQGKALSFTEQERFFCLPFFRRARNHSTEMLFCLCLSFGRSQERSLSRDPSGCRLRKQCAASSGDKNRRIGPLPSSFPSNGEAVATYADRK